MAEATLFSLAPRDAVLRPVSSRQFSRPTGASTVCLPVCRMESQFLPKARVASSSKLRRGAKPLLTSTPSGCQRCVKVSARLAPPERPAAPSEWPDERNPFAPNRDGDSAAVAFVEKMNGASVRREEELMSAESMRGEQGRRVAKSHHVGMIVKVQGEDLEPKITCEKRTDHPTLVLMRHGESMWNDLKLFTGDVDIPLTERGVMEAMAGGRSVADIDFDMIFTSRLVRSKQTALLAMTQSAHKAVPVIVRGGYYGRGKTGDENRLRLREAAAQALKQAACRMIPVYADQRLNERCYGDLQGLNKEAAAKEFGHEQVAIWRRSHDTRPPKGESLLDTAERSLAFFLSTVEPRLAEGKNVLVVAHGNVLRCIISYLCDLTEMEMLRLHIGTAHPYTFAFDGETYAQCCALPPIDPLTKRPKQNVPVGLVSALKKADEIDSLI
eukprot:TRINITY_DN36060_c2_g1_i2.p1 TRINITY_DN36060_c2_g1~~TRINITY_DN36060_c2_g1_i2.p1  ORF type:complete len:441 (-),score=-5.54 TRINITY_DN36060_c2_g1_i2:344-1666(-)